MGFPANSRNLRYKNKISICRKGPKFKYPGGVRSKPCRRKEQKKIMISFLTDKKGMQNSKTSLKSTLSRRKPKLLKKQSHLLFSRRGVRILFYRKRKIESFLGENLRPICKFFMPKKC